MRLRDLARGVWRHSRRAAVLALALVAAGIVTSFSVELGPGMRQWIESAATTTLQRPVHIGTLSIRLFGGRFVGHDIVIEGLSRTDAPFFEAREIVVSMPLWSLLRRQLIIESAEISDWRAAVETWPGDRNNLPRLRSTTPRGSPSPIRVSASYVHAYRGQFTYDDHRNWSTVARNLDITVMNLAGYRGTSRSSGSVITIGQYEPMSAAMNTWFRIDGGKILFDRVELNTYGAETLCTGVVNVARWPEMRFAILRSTIPMPHVREIFWAHDQFTLSGVMQFKGTFRLFKGGHEVAGTFSSADSALNRYHFLDVTGALVWTPWRLDVSQFHSRFYGGSMALTYVMDPLGQKTPGTARLDTIYEGVDLEEFSDAMEFDGIRFAGRATGRNLMEWAIGKYSGHSGFGDVTVEAPPRVTLRGRALPAVLPEPSFAHVYGDPFPPLGHVPFGGEVHYTFGPEWVDLAPSHLATRASYVEFRGRTAYGLRSILPFHVTSSDWQESDSLLSGILTAFGSKTRPIEVGGVGTFDGVLLNAIWKPRIEGMMAGRRMRAWDVEWGTAQSHVIYENSYADIADAVIRKGIAEMRIEGRFSLGFPRPDGGEQINARFTTHKWPLIDVRHFFELDEYPMNGGLSGEFHLYGAYLEPFGFGRADVSSAETYGERFDSATSAIRFEGAGARFDGLELRKGTGLITGAAHITWAGSYSFSAEGRQIPVDTVDALRFPLAPPTGLIDFKAGGSGVFLNMEYDVTGHIRDLYVGDEGLADLVTGKIGMRGDNVNFELQAGSTRLGASMAGTVNRRSFSYPGDITLRVTDTSLDPYARLFAANLSPFARAIVSGTVRISGTLGNLDGIVARAVVDKVDLSLFDYSLRNDGVIDIGVGQSTVQVHQFNLTGDETRLGVSGTVDFARRQIGIHARGDANLGILQMFSGNIRGSGRAELTADVTGDIDHPQIGGSAILDNGRLRNMFLPHAIENLNGPITFAGNSIRFDEVVAKVGGGNVKFAGRILLNGLWPSVLDVTASGESMELRYPDGLRSLVDADLALRGSIGDPLLSGIVTVRRASYTKRIDLEGELNLAGGAAPSSGASAGTAFPLRFNIQLVARSSLEINNNLGRITSSADLTLRGTLDRPLVYGGAEIERGDVWFEGRRYLVTRGTFDFVNPGKLDPYFDVEAETSARAPGQTYRVTLRVRGHMQRFDYEMSSDPPLPEVDILSMLLGEARPTQDAELRALQAPNAAQQTLIQSRAARMLAGRISSNVQKVVEQTFGVDTFQITPMLADPAQQTTRFAPGARLTVGKRISDRAYVTYSRSLTASARDQVIMLEYDQSDRLSWILTQNEDKTYALDVRVRRVFR
ncbi:MAG: translocation/assembly module TamB domain-containing protein [Acidobacteria bacterium]|nr:translocation/assembly module TamB domain-containing protein [Acidobacteriota bacterium]